MPANIEGVEITPLGHILLEISKKIVDAKAGKAMTWSTERERHMLTAVQSIMALEAIDIRGAGESSDGR